MSACNSSLRAVVSGSSLGGMTRGDCPAASCQLSPTQKQVPYTESLLLLYLIELYEWNPSPKQIQLIHTQYILSVLGMFSIITRKTGQLMHTQKKKGRKP